nr:MAG: hypothetical protein [Bacteriophage sp.]
MEEKTLFKLARAITDTGTDTVSSKGGTVTYRITSLKRKLVNGKVVSTSTPSCTLGSASVSWAIWEKVTVGDGYLDVKINYSENTGSEARSTTLIFNQDGSNNKINLTVTQRSSVTYKGYIKMVSNSLPLGGNKGDTAQILVMAYLKGSDGSEKPETPHVGSAPDWCSVSVASVGTLENHYMLSLTALSSNKTGVNRSGHIFLTCGDANLSIPVTQESQRASTFTLSGLPTDTGYYLFGMGAKPQNTSSLDQTYIQSLSATGTTTMRIPFYANDSEPGSLIECTTGNKVTVYTKSVTTWILKGSFIVPSAGGTVSI